MASWTIVLLLTTMQALLQVKVSPIDIVRSTSITSARGSNVTLECVTEAGPSNLFLWFYNIRSLVCKLSACSDGIFNFNATVEEILGATLNNHYSTVFLKNVSAVEHGGEYTCLVFNDSGIGLSFSYISFIVEIVSQPKTVTAQAGELAVSFSCEAEAYPYPNYQWQKKIGNQFVDIETESNTSVYRFSPTVQFNSAGVYRCVASNEINGSRTEKNSDQAVLYVHPGNTTMINAEPMDKVDGSFLFVEQTSAFDLICTAQGGPNNTHIWTVNGLPLSDTSEFMISTITYDNSSQSTISVASANASTHSGIYICSVSNPAIYSSMQAASDTFEVIVSPKGIVESVPNTVIASQGDNVTLSCLTEAIANTVWMFDIKKIVCTQSNCSDGIFGFNATDEKIIEATVDYVLKLELNTITAASGGEYVCIVINDAGMEFSTSSLFVKPYITEHPMDPVKANFSDELTLSCSADSFPQSTFQWQKEFQDIPGENSTVLVLQELTFLDTGLYRCGASITINNTNFTTYSKNALVIVNPISPKGSVLLNGPLFVKSGQEVSYNCTAQGGPDNVHTWMIDGMIIEDNDAYNINTEILSISSWSELTILSVDPVADKGSLTCNVSNVGGSEMDELLVTVSPEGIVFSDPVNATASRGDNVTFTCQTKAGPNTLFLWFYNIKNLVCLQSNCSDGIFVFNVSKEDILNSALAFSNILQLIDVNAADNGGEYTCVALNDAGVGISVAMLYFFPQFIVEPSDFAVNYSNDTATLICRAEGFPQPTYQWEQRFGMMYSRISEGGMEETFVHQGIEHTAYRCIATNDIGDRHYSAVSRLAVIYVAPSIVQDPSSTNTSVSVDDIILNCTAAGFPVPSINWFHNDSIIQEQNSRINTTTYKMLSPLFGGMIAVLGELVISMADVNDTGFYECQATSFVGENISAVSNKALVLVQNVPQPPHSVGSVDVFSRNLTLLWMIPYDNNAPILGYIIFYTNPYFINEGKDVTIVVGLNENFGKFEVKDLHPGEYYEFTVVAFNEEGNSTQSDAYRIQTLEEKPVGPPQAVKAWPLAATQISMKWKPPNIEARHGRIVSYDVMYAIEDDNEVANWKQVFTVSTVLTGLQEYVRYSVSVRARTGNGPGPLSNPLFVHTNESYPGPMNPPSHSTVKSTEVDLMWDLPEDPNGIIISFNIEVEPLRFNETSPNRLVDGNVLACYRFLNLAYVPRFLAFGRMAKLALIPYTHYRVRISANTIAGPGNYSNYTHFSTPEDDLGEIVNLAGITRDTTSIILSWNEPPCPNGPIDGYFVYYRKAGHTQSKPINSSNYKSLIASDDASTSAVINGLTPATTYAFHVRAFNSENNYGLVDREIIVKISSQVVLNDTALQSILSHTSKGSHDLLIGLPSSLQLASIGITRIIFYGVVIIPNPNDEFTFEVDNFDETYPNLQPYNNRGSNKYYIAAGWNKASSIPEDFEAGDESRTTAVRNGVEENYFNAKLKPETLYCFYILINYASEFGNEVLVRYVELSCTETEQDNDFLAVVVGSAIMFFLMVCLASVLVYIFWSQYRKRKRTAPTQTNKSAVYDISHTDTVIMNRAFIKENDRRIRSADFPAHVKNMHFNNDMMFSDEFSVIEPQHKPTAIAAAANKGKNRYQDYVAYDHSRVILMKPSGDSGYINANFINGYSAAGSIGFIATQGPMENTVADFWCMIWENNVPVIVMLTELKQYWPDSLDDMPKYGSVTVELKDEADKGSYVIRSLLISKAGSGKRFIQQFHFKTWPDYQATRNSDELLSFIDSVTESYTSPSLNPCPIVVHCSTGVGQTGVFIAVSVQLEQAKKENMINVFDCVQNMRRQRASMVLNETQYIFIHDVLVKAIERGNF